MEADWEVEVGAEAPVIEIFWPGWIDLRASGPDAIAMVSETLRLPALEEALRQLNGSESPLWTSKCDLWSLAPEDAPDPYEMDALPHETAAGLACYLDCLPRQGQVFATLSKAEAFAREVAAVLHSAPNRCCRADMIIRQAVSCNAIHTPSGFGITVYLTGCGVDEPGAQLALSNALATVAQTFCSMPQSLTTPGAPTLP